MKDRTRERFDLFMDIYGNNLRELAYWVMADEQGGWHGNTHAMPLTLKDADADARQPSLLIDSFKAVPLQALPPDAQEYWQSEMTQNKPGRCLALLHYTKPDGKQAGTYVSYTFLPEETVEPTATNPPDHYKEAHVQHILVNSHVNKQPGIGLGQAER